MWRCTVLADDELGGDLAVRPPGRDECEHFPLAACQRVRSVLRTRTPLEQRVRGRDVPRRVELERGAGRLGLEPGSLGRAELGEHAGQLEACGPARTAPPRARRGRRRRRGCAGRGSRSPRASATVPDARAAVALATVVPTRSASSASSAEASLAASTRPAATAAATKPTGPRSDRARACPRSHARVARRARARSTRRPRPARARRSRAGRSGALGPREQRPSLVDAALAAS